MCAKYVTAIPNLVGREHVTEANSRLQITFSLASIIGPILSGIIAARFGPLLAIGIDAISFAFSALSLLFIRLQSTSTVVSATQESSDDASKERSEQDKSTSILIGMLNSHRSMSLFIDSGSEAANRNFPSRKEFRNRQDITVSKGCVLSKDGFSVVIDTQSSTIQSSIL